MVKVFAACLLVCVGAFGQTVPQQSTESLTLSAGDLIKVHVVEAPELDQSTQIDDHGHILLSLAGDIDVNGLSASETALKIEKALIANQIVRNPHVAVTIERYATKNVTVLGQVKSPGSYYIGTPRTVLDVLALAGGTTDYADHNIMIEHAADGKKVPYYQSNDPQEALKTNEPIYPGDRVIVPKVRVVYLIGDFSKPGGYPALTNNSQVTVLQAVAFAGGTPPTAVPSHAKLIHHNADGTYSQSNLELSAMQKGRRPDFVLQPDDIIYLPYSYIRNVAVNINSLLAAAASSAIYIH